MPAGVVSRFLLRSIVVAPVALATMFPCSVLMTAEIRSDLKACMRHRRQVPWEFLCTRYHCKVNSSCLIPPFFCDLSPLAYISPVSAARWWCSERVTPGAGQAFLIAFCSIRRRPTSFERDARNLSREPPAEPLAELMRMWEDNALLAHLVLLRHSPCWGARVAALLAQRDRRHSTASPLGPDQRRRVEHRDCRPASNSTMWTVRNSHVRLQDPLGGGSYRPASFVHDPSLHAGLSRLRQIS